MEVFAVVQVRPFEKFLRGALFAPSQFDAPTPQKIFPAARDEHLSAAGDDGARRFGHRPELSGVNLPRLRTLIRHRSGKKLAGGTTKKGERAWPWSKPAHAVEDFTGGERPVDAAVLLFKQCRHGGFGVILRNWFDRSVAQ